MFFSIPAVLSAIVENKETYMVKWRADLLLFGSHAVIVEPVDDRFGTDADLGRQVFEGGLVRVRVPLERLSEGVLLLLTEEDARFLLARTGRRQLLLRLGSIAQLIVRAGRRTLHPRYNETMLDRLIVCRNVK